MNHKKRLLLFMLVILLGLSFLWCFAAYKLYFQSNDRSLLEVERTAAEEKGIIKHQGREEKQVFTLSPDDRFMIVHYLRFDSQKRQMVAVSLQPQGNLRPSGSAQPHLSLLAVSVQEGNSRALIMDNSRNQTFILKEGEKIALYELIQITTNKATLSNGQEEMVLSLTE
jgi:hypothetical protein